MAQNWSFGCGGDARFEVMQHHYQEHFASSLREDQGAQTRFLL
jgi:hypothetical protein